ncbi:MAG: PQQ-binding-like beta-propeller repeat protein [Gemmataceae bacterium]|nr:PQQ-binding-like beta-propeller repeat protein [Gemmataceae bacterium]
MIAFDKRTGKEAWASELKDEAGHTGAMTPMTVEGVPCVAVWTQRNLAVVRLDAGREGQTVATFPWVTDFANSIAGPAVEGDCVLLAAAYNHNAMVKVRVTLAGAEEVWRKKYPSKVCTPVIHEGSIYVAWQRVRCIDWTTGDLKWEGGSVADPGSCVVTGDGRLVVYGLNGKLILVEGAGRSPTAYKELAVRDKLFKSAAWPHVALAGGMVYCRDRDGNLAAFRSHR